MHVFGITMLKSVAVIVWDLSVEVAGSQQGEGLLIHTAKN